MSVIWKFDCDMKNIMRGEQRELIESDDLDHPEKWIDHDIKQR